MVPLRLGINAQSLISNGIRGSRSVTSLAEAGTTAFTAYLDPKTTKQTLEWLTTPGTPQRLEDSDLNLGTSKWRCAIVYPLDA